MSQRALITGIGGFAAGYLAAHLLDSGDEVLGTDLAERPEEGGAVCWDLSDPMQPSPETLAAIDEFAPTVIYHLAAVSVPNDCGTDEPTARAAAVNVEGTRGVVALAALLPSRPRVLFTSSSYVYGKPDPRNPVVDEAAPLAPRRGYGKSKLAAERVVLKAAKAGAVDAVIARSFQHTGPKQSPRMMLPEWAAQCAGFAKKNGSVSCERIASADAPIEVHTKDAHVDVTDVRDTVRAYRLLAEKGKSGTVYNVGSGKNRRAGDILALLMEISGVRRDVLELHPGFKQDPISKLDRIRADVAWEPQITIEETVGAVWRYWSACRGEW